jgi:hypothetical protein
MAHERECVQGSLEDERPAPAIRRNAWSKRKRSPGERKRYGNWSDIPDSYGPKQSQDPCPLDSLIPPCWTVPCGARLPACDTGELEAIAAQRQKARTCSHPFNPPRSPPPRSHYAPPSVLPPTAEPPSEFPASHFPSPLPCPDPADTSSPAAHSPHSPHHSRPPGVVSSHSPPHSCSPPRSSARPALPSDLPVFGRAARAHHLDPAVHVHND